MVESAITGDGLFDTAQVLKEIKQQDIIACLEKLTDESSVLSVIDSLN